MKKLIFIVAVATLGLSSCSKNEIQLNETDENAITFDTYTGVAARGAVLEQSDLQTDGFGVFAFSQGSDGYANYTSTEPNFMYNTKVAYNSSSEWDYSPVKYWSTTSTDQYSFFAYSPYAESAGGNGITVSGNDVVGTPYLTFTLASTQATMVDLVAGQNMDIKKSDNSGEVSINFKHQLTRLNFKAVSGVSSSLSGVENTYINIRAVNILGSAPTDGTNLYITAYQSSAFYSSAKYTFATTTTDDEEENHTTSDDATAGEQDGIWDYTSSSQISNKFECELKTTDFKTGTGKTFTNTPAYTTEGVFIATSNTSTATIVSLFEDDDYLFLIPPYNATGLSSTDSKTIKVEILYDVIVIDSSLNAGYIVTSEDNLAIATLTDGTLEQGHAYEFTFTINGTSIVDPTDATTTDSAFDAVSVTGNMMDWDETDYYDSTSDNDYPITVQ